MLSPKRISLTAAFLSLSLLCLSSTAKIAFVVGNGAYANYAALKNPKNDAAAVSAQLQGMGFEVTTLIDAKQTDFEEKLIAFCDRLRGDPDSIGLFYYAGHAVQADGMNYLIPVDANIPSASFLRSRAVSMQIVLDELGAAKNKANIVVLDACRNNPFAWSRDLTRGLAVVRAQPAGSVVVYSTNDNNVALDGEGENSVFADALLRHLSDEGDFDAVIDAAAREVIAQTGGKQTPAVYKQLFEKIYLRDDHLAAAQAGISDTALAPVSAAPKPASSVEREAIARGPFAKAIQRNGGVTLTAMAWLPPADFFNKGFSINARANLSRWWSVSAQIGILTQYNWASLEEIASEKDSQGGGKHAFLTAGAGIRAPFRVWRPYFDAQLGLAYCTFRKYSDVSYSAEEVDTISFDIVGKIGFELCVADRWGLDIAAGVAGGDAFGGPAMAMGASYRL